MPQARRRGKLAPAAQDGRRHSQPHAFSLAMTSPFLAAFRAALRPLTPALLVGTLALSGCDSGNDGPDEGSFDVTVAGSFSDSFSGLAAFATEVDPENGSVFAIGLVNEESENEVVVLVGKGAPAERTYELTMEETEDAEGAALFAVQTSEEEGALYMAESGTLTVTDAATDRLRGRFEFEAVNILDETDTVTLSGTFDAPRGEVAEPAALVAAQND
jgi:hypothetical protein